MVGLVPIRNWKRSIESRQRKWKPITRYSPGTIFFSSTSFYFFIDLEEKKKKISSKRSLLLLLYHLKAAAAPFGLRWGLVGPASPIKGAALWRIRPAHSLTLLFWFITFKMMAMSSCRFNQPCSMCARFRLSSSLFALTAVFPKEWMSLLEIPLDFRLRFSHVLFAEKRYLSLSVIDTLWRQGRI